jgi:para-aminobenzoate synthetase/4-amino-4-deoxychorismate lyase
VRCRIDHSAAGQPALELRDPQGVVEARAVSDVVPLLAEVEAAARRGLYAAGYVAYEAAPAFDPALRVHAPLAPEQADAPRLPLAWFGLFSAVSPAPPLSRKQPVPPRGAGTGAGNWVCDLNEGEHAAGVHRIREEIAAGNTYLVNLTTRVRRACTRADDPFDLYRRLVGSYASGYHAYLETPDWAVACGSPELFFEWWPPVIVTRPMKGTAARGRWSDEDASHARALSTSPKERAENIMVVDLLRNDLGRIAVPGGVTVPALCELEQHPTVWQMSSTVRATTSARVGLPEIFGALFPCASVTGAPKVSTMSVIADIETSPRGVYCGAVGLVRPAPAGAAASPSARFAVAIRTAVVDRSHLSATYGSGGGITWDSTTPREWEEVLLKARALEGVAESQGVEGLLETMAFDPSAGPGGAIRHLGDHLARLGASARYFGLPAPDGAPELLARAVAGLEAPARVRLLLRSGGAIEIETSQLLAPDPTSVVSLCIDAEPVDSSERTLFHKTTDRARYDERMRRHPTVDDVVLINERGEVTETTRATVAVRLGERWCTPPLRCGLLPGIQRAKDLTNGRLVERVITMDDLLRADAVATLSSLRGWRAARVLPTCECRASLARLSYPEPTLLG